MPVLSFTEVLFLAITVFGSILIAAAVACFVWFLFAADRVEQLEEQERKRD